MLPLFSCFCYQQEEEEEEEEEGNKKTLIKDGEKEGRKKDETLADGLITFSSSSSFLFLSSISKLS